MRQRTKDTKEAALLWAIAHTRCSSPSQNPNLNPSAQTAVGESAAVRVAKDLDAADGLLDGKYYGKEIRIEVCLCCFVAGD